MPLDFPSTGGGKGVYPGFFPAKDGDPNALIAFRDRQVTPWNMVRSAQMRRAAIAYHYAAGNQDIELDKGSLVQGARGYTFRSRRLEQGLPSSDNNKISAPVEVEMASILKRQWVPKIPPTSQDPRVAAAAQVAEGVLLYILESGGWPLIRQENVHNFVVGGLSVLTSFLDLSYIELHQVGVPTAIYCLECRSPYHSQAIPPTASQLLKYGSDRLQPMPQGTIGEGETEMAAGSEGYLRMGACPQCGGGLSENFEGGPEVNPKTVDFLGRPLMMDTPIGRQRFEADSVFEWYPENCGLRVTPQTMRRWWRRKVRSLDWLDEHVPHAIDEYGIGPEMPQKLLLENPDVGTWGTIRRYTPQYDGNLFDHHVSVDEGVELPTVRNPRGRYCMIVQNQVLLDEDLLIEGKVGGETVYAPRIQVSLARYRLRKGEIWGAGLPDGVISKQNRYNTILRQIALVRSTLGTPHILAPEGMDIRDPAMIRNYGPRLLRYVMDPGNPELKPTIFPGAAFPTESYRELEVLDKDIKEEVGPQEIDYGAAPKNITTTSGLQILGENSQTRRNPREDEYFASIDRMWSHLMQLEGVHRNEEALYEVAGPNNTWAVEKYTNLSLCGLVKVRSEKQAFAEQSIVRRESMREAKTDGLLDVTSPVVRREMLKGYGLSGSLNEDSSLQMDRADQLYIDFLDKGEVPIADETLDNHAIRWLVYGLHLLENEGVDVQKAVRWPEVLRVIAGWEDDLQGMLATEAESLQLYGRRFTSEQDPEYAAAFAQQKVDFVKKSQAYAAQTKQGESALRQTGQAPPPSAPPPVEPAPPAILPALMQDKIFAVWLSKLKMPPEGTAPDLPQFLAGPPVQVGERQVSPMGFLKFRALAEAHRQLMLKAMPPAPGSGATGIPGDKGSPTGPLGSAPGPEVPPGAAPQVPSLPEGGRTTGRLS